MSTNKKGAPKVSPIKIGVNKKKTKDRRFFWFACLTLLLGFFIWGVARNDEADQLSQIEQQNSHESIHEDENAAGSPSISATMSAVEEEEKKESMREAARKRNAIKKRQESVAKNENGHQLSSGSSDIAASSENSSHASVAEESSSVQREENTVSSNRAGSASTSANKNNNASSRNSSSYSNIQFKIDEEALQYYSNIEAQKQIAAFEKSNPQTPFIAENNNGVVELKYSDSKSSISANMRQVDTPEAEENQAEEKKDARYTISGAKIFSTGEDLASSDDEEYNLDEMFEDVLFAADGTIIPHSGIPYGSELYPLKDTLPWHPYISLAYIKEEKETFVAEKVRRMPTYGSMKPMGVPGSMGAINNKIDYGVAINPK